MIRALALWALIPFVASAQLQLFTLESNGSGEKAAPAVIEMGTVPIGETVEQRFRIRNTGQGAITLQTLRTDGAGFRAINYPSLPHIVAPGTNVDFRVQFSPPSAGSYNATLRVNTSSILLLGTAAASAILYSGTEQLRDGSTVDFGTLERNQGSTRTLSLRNSSNVRVSVNSLSIGPAVFRLVRPLSFPLELAPGQAQDFDIAFAPVVSGIARGTLVVDGRTINLTGTATEPPFPRPTVILETSALTSARQVKVSVQLASASRAVGDGRLIITFQPVNGVADNDPAIQFLANSSRIISFRVREGETQALFGESRDATLQTGTSAGTIVVTAEAGGFSERITAVVPPASIQIDRAAVLRNGSQLNLTVAGYDNTRTMRRMTFKFFNAGGTEIASIDADAADAVTRYFAESRLGGTFSLNASFPVAGDASQIAAAEVQMINSSGTTSTQRLRF